MSSSPEINKIGFVGLGNMGLPMCLNLKKSEKTILAFDTNASALDKAEKGGIQCADSLPEIGLACCDIIFTMLPGDDAVHQVMPVLMKTWPCILVDCSTVSPTTSRHWHSQVAVDGGPGSAMFDAPVSGGVKVKESFVLPPTNSIQSGSSNIFISFLFLLLRAIRVPRMLLSPLWWARTTVI
jgi:3-hydroxyisobutyrate dehydrogenase-like beta-hydroxyacid dehydrogenase